MLDRFQPLRPLIPHGELAAELRLLGRDDERACQDERRLLNRLRADLLAVFPAAVEIAGPDMGAPTFLRMLQRWPTALAATSRQDLVAFAAAPTAATRTGSLIVSSRRWAASPSPPARHLPRPRSTPSSSRSRSCCSSAPSVEPGSGAGVSCCWAHPDAAAASCQPRPNVTGARRCLAARSTSAFRAWVTVSPPGSAGEIGDRPEQFQPPNSLQRYAGQAPVTRRSGKRELLITRRLACNRHLADAVHIAYRSRALHPAA